MYNTITVHDAMSFTSRQIQLGEKSFATELIVHIEGGGQVSVLLHAKGPLEAQVLEPIGINATAATSKIS